MRRYPSGTLIYGPGDPVLVLYGDTRVWGRVVTQQSLSGKVQSYRVRFADGVRVVESTQIIKQADTGETGFVKHLKRPGNPGRLPEGV